MMDSTDFFVQVLSWTAQARTIPLTLIVTKPNVPSFTQSVAFNLVIELPENNAPIFMDGDSYNSTTLETSDDTTALVDLGNTYDY